MQKSNDNDKVQGLSGIPKLQFMAKQAKDIYFSSPIMVITLLTNLTMIMGFTVHGGITQIGMIYRFN